MSPPGEVTERVMRSTTTPSAPVPSRMPPSVMAMSSRKTTKDMLVRPPRERILSTSGLPVWAT